MHHFIGILAILIATTVAAPTSDGASNNLGTSASKPDFIRIDHVLSPDSKSSGCDWAPCETSYSRCLKTCNSLSNGDWYVSPSSRACDGKKLTDNVFDSSAVTDSASCKNCRICLPGYPAPDGC